MSDTSLALTASVAMHVAWNLMARHQPEHAFPLWWVLLAHLLLLGPWGIYALVWRNVYRNSRRSNNDCMSLRPSRTQWMKTSCPITP